MVKIVQLKYRNPQSRVRSNGTFSDVHQGSVLNTLLIVLVLEALSRKIRLGCPEYFLYTYELTLEGLKGKLEAQKGALESKGLRVNVKKTKIMISSENDGMVKTEDKFSCAVYRKGVGSNSILCQFCRWWVYKRCSGIRDKLKRIVSLNVTYVYICKQI